MEQSNCRIEGMSIHHVGNKTNGEALVLSDAVAAPASDKLHTLLMQYFLSAFGTAEYYTFSFSNGDVSLNPVFRFAQQCFDTPSTLHSISIDMARHLYEVSAHPQIKAGDLFVVYFRDMEIENHIVDAIGIFKAENQQVFLLPEWEQTRVAVNYAEGISADKLDKGCLIFNVQQEEGYRVCTVDKASRQGDAQFWKDHFLMLKPCGDEFHHTKELLTIARQYVTQQFAEEFDVSKTDQIDLLNRSLGYFKTHQAFDKEEFEQEVFHHPEMIRSFQQFNDDYCHKHELDISDGFDISRQAVKNQARIFKSVLKLDKNFHIYIHGNKDMIEKGVDADGRKYYKIYFENES